MNGSPRSTALSQKFKCVKRRDDMKVNRVESIIIKEDHPKFKIIDQQCFHSKNLYNEANYITKFILC